MAKKGKTKIPPGWIKINMIFEMIGNPKEYIENTLKDYMINIGTDSNIKILEEDYGKAEEIEKGLFSTFVEANMLVNGLEKLTWLCMNFTPASIEIIEPSDFKFNAGRLQNWINDLLSNLHEVGIISKQIASENKLIVKNMNRLIKNNILLCINAGFDTPKEMEEKTGIPYKQLKPFFDALIKEGKLAVHENKYKKIDSKPKKKAAKKASKKKK